MEDLPLTVDGPVESISGGALVLVEGEKGRKARELMQQISLGILENGRSVTYVTTSQSVQDLVMEMFERDERIATYLPDHRLLCVPVYPLIEGKGTRDGLLDKLMGSEQLQTSDALIIDSLSDFLGERFEEASCIRVLEFVQNLNGTGKAVFLVVNDGQKGILPVRLESELQLSLPSGEEGIVQMKRYQHAHQGAAEMLRFQIHPTTGILAHPLTSESP
jgi:archaeal flagellar protein FlaH